MSLQGIVLRIADLQSVTFFQVDGSRVSRNHFSRESKGAFEQYVQVLDFVEFGVDADDVLETVAVRAIGVVRSKQVHAALSPWSNVQYSEMMIPGKHPVCVSVYIICTLVSKIK